MTNNQERRTHPRKSCLLSIDWSYASNVFTNAIQNISLGGMFIETNEPFEPGQTISLKILAPAKLKKVTSLKAKVVRVEPSGIAVEFTKESPEQVSLVEYLIDNI